MNSFNRFTFLFIFLSTCAALVDGVDADGQSIVTEGLIAYYPLNGNANDVSGNGNNGTANNVIPTQDRFGLAGMAYQFNGINSAVTCNIPNIPTGANPRTVSLWAKTQPTPSQGVNLLFWGTNQNTKAFGIMQNSSPYTWQGQTFGGGNDVDSGVIVDTSWHHVVVTYDGTDDVIYIDGVRKNTLAIGIDTPFSVVTIGIGINTPFTGAINEVRIYNRALSAQEVSELYQGFVSGIIALPTITITGITNQTYAIQYVNSLSPTNWTTLVSNITTTPFIYPDTNAVGQPKRFYRVIAQ